MADPLLELRCRPTTAAAAVVLKSVSGTGQLSLLSLVLSGLFHDRLTSF